MDTDRRLVRERDLRRSQIMNAAKEVFTAKGFHGAIRKETASRAELSTAGLYTYSRSRRALYDFPNGLVLGEDGRRRLAPARDLLSSSLETGVEVLERGIGAETGEEAGSCRS
jgi:AcrR family transcriptional regulator